VEIDLGGARYPTVGHTSWDIYSWRRTSITAIAVLLISALTTAGCAVGGVGFMAAKVTSARGAWVVDLHTFGVHVRPTIADDLGFSLGLSRRSYVFATQEVSPLESGWHLLYLPGIPFDRAIVRDTETAGVDVRMAPREAGATLGVLRVTASRPQLVAETSFRSILYMPQYPGLTCFTADVEERC